MIMMDNGKIFYDQEMKIDVKIWNLFIGCMKVLLGCKYCYVEIIVVKFYKWGIFCYEKGFKFVVYFDCIEKVVFLKCKKLMFYFINFMSDIFYEDVDDVSIDQVMDIVRKVYWYVFYILIKRS